jgi:hypothetical protein
MLLGTVCITENQERLRSDLCNESSLFGPCSTTISLFFTEYKLLEISSHSGDQKGMSLFFDCSVDSGMSFLFEALSFPRSFGGFGVAGCVSVSLDILGCSVCDIKFGLFFWYLIGLNIDM